MNGFSVKTERSDHIDAIKGGAIFLVVFGHFLEPYQAHGLIRMIFTAIYSFHMPLMVFLTGIFARPFIEKRDRSSLIERIVIPLFLFHVIYSAFADVLNGSTQFGAITPYWLLWFLLSLLFWRLLLPIFSSVIGLCLAIALALGIGYAEPIGYELSLSRTLYFLPFFILGHLFGRVLIDQAQQHRKQAIALFLSAISLISIWAMLGLDPSSLFGSKSYALVSSLKQAPLIGRAMLMLIGLGALIGFCALMPARNKMLQYFGRNIFAIYLLHGFFILLANQYLPPHLHGVFAILAAGTAMSLALCVGLAAMRPVLERSIHALYESLRRFNSQLAQARFLRVLHDSSRSEGVGR